MHTPLPWRAEVASESLDSRNTVFSDATKTPVITSMRGADARFIAHACNSHADLLKTLKDAREAIESLPIEALGMATDHPNYGHGWPIRDELLSQISYAIAKAKEPE